MRKFVYASAIFASVMMASCGGSSSDKSLEQAQTFAVDVANKISKNQKEAVALLYPAAEKADSFVTSFVADSVKVLPTDSANIFTADLGGGKTFTIQKIGEDSLVVTGSKGLFAFAAKDIEFAKKTGLYADSLTDAENLERWADIDALRQHLMTGFKPSNPLVIKQTDTGWDNGTCEGWMAYKVTNVSQNAVSGEDYKIAFKVVGMGKTFNYSKPGKDLAAGASATFEFKISERYISSEKTEIIYNLSKEQQFDRSYDFKGDEYEKFLEANGKNK